MVYVVDKNGKALMPTEKHGKVRRLLKEGKAKIFSRKPFTIQLLYDSEKFIQPAILGVDAGFGTIGLAVASSTGKLLYTGNAILRDKASGIGEKIKKLLQVKKIMRRGRRNRKCRYRFPKFRYWGKGKAKEEKRRKKSGDKSKRIDPRKGINRLQGFTPPTMKARLNAHTNLIRNLIKIMPIRLMRIEIAQFDQQAIKNPEIEGVGYQNGALSEVRGLGLSKQKSRSEYIKIRDKYKCHYAELRPDIKCNLKLTVDHIIPQSKGGSWSTDNLVCSCFAHNLAKGKMSYKEFTGKKPKKIKELPEPAFMNLIENKLIPELEKTGIPVQKTYGFWTRRNRVDKLKLVKTHVNDAISITGIPITKERLLRTNITTHNLCQVRKTKRSLHKAQAEAWQTFTFNPEAANAFNEKISSDKTTVNKYSLDYEKAEKKLKKLHKNIKKQTYKFFSRARYGKEFDCFLQENDISEEEKIIILQCIDIEEFNLTSMKKKSKRILNAIIKNSYLSEREKEFTRSLFLKHGEPNRKQVRAKQNTPYVYKNKKKGIKLKKWTKVLIEKTGKIGYVSGFSGETNAYVKGADGEPIYLTKNKKNSYPVSGLKILCYYNNWIDSYSPYVPEFLNNNQDENKEDIKEEVKIKKVNYLQMNLF